jgi:hypothetical protein
VNLGHGDVPGALRASPLAVALLVGWPLVGTVRPPRWWRARLVRWPLIIAVLAFAEIWQLVRFGVISI